MRFIKYFVLTLPLTFAFAAADSESGEDASRIARLVFSPVTPDVLATLRGNGDLALWSTTSQQPLWQDALGFVAAPSVTASLRFSPDGSRIAAAASTGGIALVEVATGDIVSHLGSATSFYTAVAFSPDGRYLVSSEEGMRLSIWEVATGTLVRQIPTNVGGTNVLGLSEDGRFVFCSGLTSVGVWLVTTGAQVAAYQDPGLAGEITDHPNDFLRALLINVDFAPNMAYFALAMIGRVVILDAESGAEAARLVDDDKMFLKVSISRDTAHASTLTPDGKVAIWDLASQSKTAEITLTDWFTGGEPGTINFNAGEIPADFSMDGTVFAYLTGPTGDTFHVVRVQGP